MTAADCQEGYDCIKGFCFVHEEGMCDEDGDCLGGEICAWHMCEAADQFCQADGDCQEWESCHVDCVLFEYSAEGGMSDTCITEAGECDLDPDKLEAPQACIDFCEHIMPCEEAEAVVEDVEEGSGSGATPEGKEDDMGDEEVSEQEECEIFCAVGMTMEESKNEMQALIDCALQYEDCDEMEVQCEAEAEALLERLFGELDEGVKIGDDEEGGEQSSLFGFEGNDEGGESPPDGDARGADGSGDENSGGGTGDGNDSSGGGSGCSLARASGGNGGLAGCALFLLLVIGAILRRHPLTLS